MPTHSETASTAESQKRWSSRLKTTGLTIYHHFRKHTGVGIVCAVAYFDPGNWGVDLQAGSQFGYKLLFVVLLAGLFAVFLQVLASRLGCVTGLGRWSHTGYPQGPSTLPTLYSKIAKGGSRLSLRFFHYLARSYNSDTDTIVCFLDLASHCRLLLHDRPKYTKLWRWLALYPLYLLAEVAIISTDLAELLGSAIALCMLFPALELWHGVLLTGFDVLIILAMGDPLRGKPVRMFEFLIAGMVLAVLICIAIIISKVDVDWAEAFHGYVPSKYIFQSGGLYTSVGIIGATVMPHSLFLGSALATQDRVSALTPAQPEEKLVKSLSMTSDDYETATKTYTPSQRWRKTFVEWFTSPFRVPQADPSAAQVKTHADRPNRPLPFVTAHLNHGIFDVVASLLGFAVLINSLILILAAAVFFYGHGGSGKDAASLFDAYDVIRDFVGKPAATLFALALLAAGQSSSLIATVAGQAVSEGFLQWRVSPILRRFLTRLIAIIPSMVVAIAAGRKGVDDLLVISQVVLSIVLPFITFPLIFLTSSKSIMSVRHPAERLEPVNNDDVAVRSDAEGGEKTVDFSSGIITTSVGAAIWLVVMCANMYVIVSLAMGTAT
ncbi:natural resistance-associated macrophage protein [Pleurotus eryngii]|uniref:Natural resistance-associated macrophage protein n=1 Tax=Pleurotus eryngii TaxID=5323 RepID=A0A9P5ZXR1_PLEER|nr:natural resistance-associated macrophage protein [Pleurotus eryngii]